jgi:hypothetical protein
VMSLGLDAAHPPKIAAAVSSTAALKCLVM